MYAKNINTEFNQELAKSYSKKVEKFTYDFGIIKGDWLILSPTTKVKIKNCKHRWLISFEEIDINEYNLLAEIQKEKIRLHAERMEAIEKEVASKYDAEVRIYKENLAKFKDWAIQNEITKSNFVHTMSIKFKIKSKHAYRELI